MPNRTTVYRILDKLVAAEEVKTIALKTGVSYYEMVKDKRHHHHFICTKCDDVFCLGGCHVKTFDIDLTKLLPNSSFSIQAHDFNLYGVCDKCGSP